MWEEKKKKDQVFQFIEKILGNKITQQLRALSLPRSHSNFQLQQEEKCPGVLANLGPSLEILQSLQNITVKLLLNYLVKRPTLLNSFTAEFDF